MNEIYLLASLIIVLVISLFWFINKKLTELKEASGKDDTLTEWLKSMQASLEGTNKTLNQVISETNKNLNQALSQTNKNMVDSLQKSTKVLNERLDNAAKYIAQVSKEVGQMSELGKSMRDLQVFLQSPKIRGNIGEQVLKDLISQVFPKGSFFLQYSFKSGEKVDAAIKTSAGILPIDSKFPMENFKKMTMAETKTERTAAKKEFIRDVKKHIQDISKKYILTEEGTLDFAFMYLPSEMVFNEVANSSELLEFARRHRVYPVSPNTLYVHLQTVLLSFEGQKIEARSRQVFRLLRAIQKDYEKTEGVLQVLGKHITNAYNQMSHVTQNFSLLGQKLNSTNELAKPDEEVKQLKADLEE
jgi:DNA recombination protein RmuC